MTLLASGALWLMGLGAIVGAVYFLKRQAQPKSVSTLMFWRGVERQPRSALRFNRMPLLGLVLQLLALMAVVLALAQPVATTSAGGAQTLALVLDGSASMRAEVSPDGERRYGRAVERARAALGANPAAEVALIGAQTTPEVLVPATTDHERIRRALDNYRPTYQGDADPSDLLRVIESQFPDGVDRVVYATDRAPSTQTAALGWQIEMVDSATDAVNVAVTAFAARTQPSGQGVAFTVEVHNGDRASRSLPLRIRSDEGTIAERTVDVPAGGRVQIDVSRSDIGARQFMVEIDPGEGRDDLADDNVRYATLPQVRPWRIHWVGGEDFYLGRFFERAGRAEVVRRDDSSSAVSATNVDLTLVHGTTLDVPQPGRYLLVGGAMPPWVAGLDGTSRGAVRIERDHPVLQGLAPDDWRVGEIPEVDVAPDGEVLLSAGGAPVLYLAAGGGVRLAYLGIDLSASNLGLSVDFPILLFRLMDWLAPRVDQASTLTVGEELPLDRLDENAEITDPEGRTCRLGQDDASCGRLDQPGVYRVTQGANVYLFAANAPAAESRLTPADQNTSTPASSSSAATSDPSSPLSSTRPLWPWALALGLGLLMAELFTFERPRWTSWRRERA